MNKEEIKNCWLHLGAYETLGMYSIRGNLDALLYCSSLARNKYEQELVKLEIKSAVFMEANK